MEHVFDMIKRMETREYVVSHLDDIVRLLVADPGLRHLLIKRIFTAMNQGAHKD